MTGWGQCVAWWVLSQRDRCHHARTTRAGKTPSTQSGAHRWPFWLKRARRIFLTLGLPAPSSHISVFTMAFFGGFPGSLPGTGGGLPTGAGAPGAGAPAPGSATPFSAGLLGAAAFPLAPQGPIAPTRAGPGGRADALGWTGTPATIGELAEPFDPPAGFEELVECLGAARDDPAEIFLCIPEADFSAAFAVIEVDGAPLTSMRKARLIAALRGMFVACGHERIPVKTLILHPVKWLHLFSPVSI